MPASRIQTSWHWAAIVRVVISSWRIRNIVSSSTSGSVSLDDITSFSSPGSFIETSPIAPRCRRAIAEVTAYDSSAGVLGWNRPLSSRASTAAVSTRATETSRVGLIGPCTVTRKWWPMIWSSSSRCTWPARPRYGDCEVMKTWSS